MTHATDPFDARAYDPYSLHLSPERDLTAPDRDAVHTAAQPRVRWSWGEWVTLAAIIGCVVVAFSDVWWPLLKAVW